jgi:hypothetical protein
LFLALKEGILKIPGSKFNANGYNMDKVKLKAVSFKRII